MPLRHYQSEGVDFLAQWDAAILADEPGLGKSAQAIVAAERRGFGSILIICPAIGRVSWPIELGKWDIAERQIVHVGQDPTSVLGPTAHIVTYDLLSRGGPVAQVLVEYAKAGNFDLMIVDEGQYLKDTGSKRCKIVYGILAHAIHNVWVLSGTITPNSNAELYPHIRTLFPDILHKLFPTLSRTPTRFEFEDRFCIVRNTPFGNGRSIQGNRNTETLRAALKPVLLRRRATEVKAELPALTIEDLAFGEDDVAALLSPNQAKALAAAGMAFDEAYRRELDEDDILHPNAPVHIATERRALGLAKVPLAAGWAEDLLTNGQDKIILFAHHKDVVLALGAALFDYAPVIITGETPIPDRTSRIRDFQNEPHVRVLVGNIQAAGTSVTLTASNRVGIIEPSWVPGDNTQAIRRSYRIGQTRAVTATFLSVAKSLDSHITKTLLRKAGDIAALLDDKEPA